MTSSPEAPESISTARLLLRRPRPGDVEAVFRRYASDPDVTRYMAWPTHRSPADTHAFLAFSDAEWARWSAGSYLIWSSVDDRLLGGTGLTFESAMEAITGYILARDAWGRGYATEVLTAMVQLAGTLGVTRLTAGCHPEHRVSQRVLEKGGFRRESLIARTSGFPNLPPGASQDLLLYSRSVTFPGACLEGHPPLFCLP
jgi:RimJ/RimL family protein N-acetyltransferase